jgi:hypothetical protein
MIDLVGFRAAPEEPHPWQFANCTGAAQATKERKGLVTVEIALAIREWQVGDTFQFCHFCCQR